MAFIGLYRVTGSKFIDWLVGVAPIDVETGEEKAARHVGFCQRGGLVDSEGRMVSLDDLEPLAGLAESRQEPLRSTLLKRAWQILEGV